MYDPKLIEQKWQKLWEQEGVYKTDIENSSNKKKYYCLDMFPYPSGAGLHVGHPEGYTATDIVSRYRRMQGDEVLHPMGWDAFGLPAENYAIKMGVHPQVSTGENIATFKKQIQSLGLSYDWNLEINTSDPKFYRWSQWFFLLLYKRGLAYRKKAKVNWCDHCKTVLANEQVIDGVCERCKSKVLLKELKQWFFKITEYTERLLEGLEDLEWSNTLKTLQKNWIGKQQGITIQFGLEGLDEKLNIFTCYPETIYGVTFMVLAPEHPLVERLTTDEYRDAVEQYQQRVAKRSDLERTHFAKTKEGVFTGSFSIHPLTGERLPIWISDFVLMDVGTGAIMAVPAHDKRDFLFAKEYALPITRVIQGVDGDDSAVEYVDQVTEEGTMLSSKELDGLRAQPEAKEKIQDILEEKKHGKKTITYHIRDWLISRQRYWGTPIPIVYCEECGEVPIPEEDLPVELPDIEEIRVGEQSPLASVEEFVHTTCPSCGGAARRETDTMDGFVDNSWYYFRYLDPQNDTAFASREHIQKWMPVDLYVGGVEHAVGHLLYSRFFTKVLYDEGIVKFEEPFHRLVNQGLILAEDGRKMSKSLGNVVNPDDVVGQYGADTLRLYEMFMGPLEDSKPWNTRSIHGSYRFLQKVYHSSEQLLKEGFGKDPKETVRALHHLISKVTNDIEKLRFNTAIAAFMSFLKADHLFQLSKESFQTFLLLLSVFAPHLSEELWARIHGTIDQQGKVKSDWHKEDSVTTQAWPEADESLLQKERLHYVVQINGKKRATFDIASSASEEDIKNEAQSLDPIQKWISGKTIQRVIVVQGRLVNIVV